MSQSSQQKLLALATVAIIALLGLSAFLIYTKVNQDKLIKKQSAELIEETRLKADLEKSITRPCPISKRCAAPTANSMP
jgi:type II secretory pathway component PulJ